MGKAKPRAPEFRDRIVGLRRVQASELRANPKNWRVHPARQEPALRGILEEVGWADALIAYETLEGLTLIDGHLRADMTGEAEVPVLVLDVTEAEADKVLATLDPLAAMAERNDEALRELLAGVEAQSDGLKQMLEDMQASVLLPISPDDFPEVEVGELDNKCPRCGYEFD